MPQRRPYGDGVVNYVRLCLALLVLASFLVEAQQQPRPAIQQKSQPESLDVTKVPQLERQPTQPYGKTYTDVGINNNNLRIHPDASALRTLAPADNSAVAAPSNRLSSPHTARSLEDWEVEDFVLLATVDGKLHGVDRKTGRNLWEPVVSETPMVETIYHRRNRSDTHNEYGPPVDNYIWAIEPSRDGAIYIYQPDGPRPGLISLDLTMKQLVEDMSPYEDDHMDITYAGKKETTLFKFDSGNGKLRSFHGSSNTIVNEGNCANNNALTRDDQEECKTNATFTLGRTEYSVTISGTKDSHLIATLKFAEWVPNNFDADLFQKYHKSLDNNYIYTRHDGLIIGNELDNEGKNIRQKFNQKLDSPVARVFDVARPWGSEEEDHKLVVLPQPIPPQSEEDHVSAENRSRNIFLNHTESGSWYAMSGRYYPGVIHGGIGLARSEQSDWPQLNAWGEMSDKQQNSALVGLHSIEKNRRESLLTLPAAISQDLGNDSRDSAIEPYDSPENSAFQQIQGWGSVAATSIWDSFSNPVVIVVLFLYLILNRRKIVSSIKTSLADTKVHFSKVFPSSNELESEDGAHPIAVPQDALLAASKPKPALSKELPEPQIPSQNEDLEKVVTVVDAETTAHPTPLPVADPNADGATLVPTTKKRARGKRGGKNHRKGKSPASEDGSPEQDKPAGQQVKTVGEAVKEAKELGPKEKTIEPDIQTRSNDPTDISYPILRVGGLLDVNEEKIIGNGSNGTLVYEGTFDGRPVAVKRMLIQFFEIASQETKLLRESDDHPNVIRYYTQQRAADFLYIALELCPASLADIIDKPQKYAELAQKGENNLPDVLYQIANGLSHLHSLRIVHRDLKPQNILVNVDKYGNPRLLVSDFGLCKKLDGEQSSFRATTAHAAGTSGWRAPELLLDDDAHHEPNSLAAIDASTNGDSGSGPLVSLDLLPHRRATRAIDIFSLGLVFFYVLTKGSHPYDKGGTFMREVNIRRGNFDLEKLEILGDYAYEAKDLIGSMLDQNPKNRPSAKAVMSHPFFWSAKKRLNFLVDVSDHFEKEPREPPSIPLLTLEKYATDCCRNDFLKHLPKDFVESLGKQRKYTGDRLLDLLRALRNKKNHYEDLSAHLKEKVGPLPDGYLCFWTNRFPDLLISCWNAVYDLGDDTNDRFKDYYEPSLL
ncbi:serine/threonine-protein kinase [Calycina marina]|uniref:non-specific serine/threonine protein kinase n=1 Tax=Calycina marina TaxID=1763456 RepID=A0A9P7ZAU0_9HELO|nr:serine/threonine-protein kinase [Calycina marina]